MEENQTPEQEIEVTVTPCPECQSGVMHLEYLTYFTWLNEELITVPNFPAWVCDLCGRRDYDSRAITWLNTLLHPEARRGSARRRRGQPANAEKRRPRHVFPD